MKNSALAGEYLEIPIEDIEPNPWNPNEMDDETFNRLATELEETGVIDPIQVVPLESGKYRIIGGEHRWRVMRVLQYEKVPCVSLTDEKWTDEDLQKFVTTRLNALRGKLNPEKFMRLYMDLGDRYAEESMQVLMGFTDRDAFSKMVGQTKASMKSAGMSDAAISELERAKSEITTIEGLSDVLNRIFTKYGSTLDRNFMWFDFGGKKHLYVSVTRKELWAKLTRMMDAASVEGLDAQDLFDALVTGWKGAAESAGLVEAAEEEEDE